MHPLRRLGLAHTEQTPMEHLNGILLEIDQNEQESIFRCGQWAVLLGRILPRLPLPPMQGPCGHVAQECRLKGRHQCCKLVHGQARQISQVGGMGWNIAIT